MTNKQAVSFMEKRGAEYKLGMFSDIYRLGDSPHRGILTLTISNDKKEDSGIFDYDKHNGRDMTNKIFVRWIPVTRFRSARHLEDFLRALGMPEDVLREG